jgi:hypothetical protein
MKHVDFFIVGAPKCGTTAMYSYLKSHPDVFFPGRKEPHFFGSDLEFHGQPRILFEEYLALFSDAKPHQTLGDASVFYLMSEKAAEEIKAYNPAAKIVIMLRNPIDVMQSFHSQRLFNGTEDIESFADAVAAETDRRQGKRMPRRIGLRQGLFYSDVVMFADQVERYFDAFGRNRTHIIIYEDLVADMCGCYRGLCSFLEIDATHNPTFDRVNSNKVVRLPWLRELFATPPQALSLAGRLVLPNASLRKSLKSTVRRINMVAKPRAALAVGVREQLMQDLTPSIAKLERLLDRDLGVWRGQTTASAMTSDVESQVTPLSK